MSDWDEMAKAAARHGDDLALVGAGIAAAVVRLAVYSGPPRPLRAVLLDSAVMCSVGLLAGEVALGLTDSVRVGISVGVLSGVTGWEVIKQVVLSRIGKETK
jgi:hypothetical protein